MAALLPHSVILDLHKAVMDHGIARDKLLVGIHSGFLSTLQKSSDDRSQIFLDLGKLNTVPKLADGSVPLQIWLRNAIYHVNAEGREGCEIYEQALTRMGIPAQMEAVPIPPAPRPAQQLIEPQAAITKILFLAANPIGRTKTDNPIQLAVNREYRMVEAAIQRAPQGRRLVLIPEFDVTVADLQRVLLEHQPNLVHFSGHGSSDGGLVLASSLSGFGKNVAKQPLSELFQFFSSSIHCIFLNACYSEELATSLKEKIDCVVGISGTIDDLSAVKFSTAFYQAIAYHQNVRTAFGLACNDLDLSRLKDADKPKLLHKNGIDPNTLILFPKSS